MNEAINPGADADSHSVGAFWEGALGSDDEIDRIEEGDFAQGFLEGALDVWDKVKEKV